jgi:hypothetical protein
MVRLAAIVPGQDPKASLAQWNSERRKKGTRMNKGVNLYVVLALLAAAAPACKSSSSPDEVALTAPTAQSPSNGATIQSTQPTLVVSNATGGTGALTYRFEVARDSAFTSMVAQADGIAQGSGTTSWQVSTPLTGGQHFWRARASAGAATGPYSSVANFTVETGFFRTTAVDNLLVFDPLTNGSTVGQRFGGDFTQRGWFCTAADKYIRYEVPTIRQGYVEFQVTNLTQLNPVSEKRHVFIMWDPTRGDYTTNAFRVNIHKLDTATVRFDTLRLRWISNGEQRDTGYDFTGWRPDQIYTWRIEWGSFPELTSSQRVRVLLDGVVIMERNYDNVYAPARHWIELGCAPRQESLEQAIYSNVRIGTR